jgi:DNA polymerase I
MIIQHIGDGNLYLRYRDDSNKLIEEYMHYRPYYWSLKKTNNENFINYDGNKVYKKYYVNPNDRFKLKNREKSYELDVALENRFLIDNFNPDVWIDFNYKVMHLDIETLNCLDTDRTPEPITAITFFDSYSNHYYTLSWKDPFYAGLVYSIEKKINNDNWTIIIASSEKEMLDIFKKGFLEINPDIITGWNVFFDIKYIINRHYWLGKNITWISPVNQIVDKIDDHTKDPIYGRIVFDLKYGYEKLHDGDIGFTSLRSVLEDNNAPIRKLEGIDDYDKDFESFLKYNCRDVEGTVWIDQEFDIIQSFLERQKLVGCKFSSTLYNSNVIDCFFLRKAHEKGIVLPTAIKSDVSESYEGATIFKPVTGLHLNVIVLDVASMYPSSMIAGNQSFDTIINNETNILQENLIKLGNDVCFRKDKISFTTSILNSIQEMRDYNKKEMKKYEEGSAEYRKYDNKQRVCKFLKNSLYGYYGFKHSRLYDIRIASSVTWLSRQAIAHIKKTVLKNYSDTKVVYGHTDSVFVESPTTKIAKDVEKTINSSWYIFEKEYNLIPNNYRIEVDKVFTSLLIAGANMYAGRLEGSNKLVVKGFALRRKSAPTIVKNLQKTVLEMILDQKPEQEIFSYIKDLVKKIRTGKCTIDEITIKCKLKQPLTNYKTNPQHVASAKWSNEHLGLNIHNAGDMVKMIAVQKNATAIIRGIPKSGVIAYDEENQLEGFTIDYEEMVTKLIEGKIRLICNAMSWDLEELLKNDGC